jgi:hypothetical protein
MDQLLEKYFIAKEKLKDLQELVEYYKEEIEDSLDESNKEYYKGLMYSVERKTTTCKRLNKKDPPEDIWDEYSKSYNITSLHVTKNGEKLRRRSRSPTRRRSR